MYRAMMKSKLHRAMVTQADVNYVGSLTISSDLMEAADLLPGEKVDIVDINNGARLSTYVIEGPRWAGTVGINGAAARLVMSGDLVIVISYATVSDEEARTMKPKVIFVDEKNRIIAQGTDPAEVPLDSALMRGDGKGGPDRRSPLRD